MELIYEERAARRLMARVRCEALIEGELPLPEGRRAEAVLLSMGKVAVTEVRAGDGAVSMEGRMCVELICAEGGELFAFTSEAAFTHAAEAEAVAAGMAASVTAALQSMELSDENGALKLSAVAALTYTVENGAPIRLVSGIKGLADIERQSLTAPCTHLYEAGAERLRLREELPGEGAIRVLCCSAEAESAAVRVDGTMAEVSGSIAVSALAAFKDGRIGPLERALPFAESVPVPEGDGELYCAASVTGAGLRSLGEDMGGLLSLDVELRLVFYRAKEESVTLVTDAYSPSAPFEVERTNVSLRCFKRFLTERRTVAERVSVPAGAGEIARVIYASARPVVTADSLEDGMLCIEGIFFTCVVYESVDGTLRSFTEDVPFALMLPAECASATEEEVEAVCLSCSATGSGSMVDIRYTLAISARLYALAETGVVTGAEECGTHAPMRGMVVYFASEGEQLFDIGKRFSLPTAALAEAGAGETLHEGEKLVLLI